MVSSRSGAPRDTPSPGSTNLSHDEKPGVVASGATDPRTANPFDSQHVLLTLGLVLTVAAVAFETLAIATVLPAVVEELGGLHLYGWAFSAFLLTQLVAIVIAGLVADQRGPGLPFAVGVVLFAAGLLVGGFAPSMQVLIAGRALQGLGGGAISAIAYVGIGRGYPEEARPRMLALLSTAWVVPGLVGPALSGVIAEGFGWRAVFLALAPLPLLTGLLAFPQLRGMPAGTPSPDARARTIGALVLAGGAGLFLAGLGNGQLVPALAMVVVGLVLLVPALRRLLPPGTLRAAPGLPATIASMGLLNLAFFGVDVFVPLTLVEVRGSTVAVAGIALTAATMAWSGGAGLPARHDAHRDHPAFRLFPVDDHGALPHGAVAGRHRGLGVRRAGHGAGLHHALPGHAGTCRTGTGGGRLCFAQPGRCPWLRFRRRHRRRIRGVAERGRRVTHAGADGSGLGDARGGRAGICGGAGIAGCACASG